MKSGEIRGKDGEEVKWILNVILIWEENEALKSGSRVPPLRRFEVESVRARERVAPAREA